MTMLRKLTSAVLPVSILICGLYFYALGPGEEAFGFAVIALLVIIPSAAFFTWMANFVGVRLTTWQRAKLVLSVVICIGVSMIVIMSAGSTIGFDGMLLAWLTIWLLSILIIRGIQRSRPEIFG